MLASGLRTVYKNGTEEVFYDGVTDFFENLKGIGIVMPEELSKKIDIVARADRRIICDTGNLEDAIDFSKYNGTVYTESNGEKAIAGIPFIMYAVLNSIQKTQIQSQGQNGPGEPNNDEEWDI